MCSLLGCTCAFLTITFDIVKVVVVGLSKAGVDVNISLSLF